MPPQQQPRSAGALRMARHRRRQQKGLRCVMIELRETEIAALIRQGRLAPESRDDLAAIKRAVHEFLDGTLK
jgi:hypothetical protein